MAVLDDHATFVSFAISSAAVERLLTASALLVVAASSTSGIARSVQPAAVSKPIASQRVGRVEQPSR